MKIEIVSTGEYRTIRHPDVCAPKAPWEDFWSLWRIDEKYRECASLVAVVVMGAAIVKPEYARVKGGGTYADTTTAAGGGV